MNFLLLKFKSISYYIYGNRFFRIFFFMNVLLILVSSVLLTLNSVGDVYSYSEGDICLETIRVKRDISYTVDDQTEILKRNAAENVPLLFDYDPDVLNDRVRYVYRLFKGLQTGYDSSSAAIGDYDKLEYLNNNFPEFSRLNKSFFDALISAKSSDELKNSIVKALSDIYDEGVLNKPYSNPLNISNTKAAFIDAAGSRDSQKSVNQLRTSDDVRKNLNEILRPYIQRFPANQQIAAVIIIRNLIVPNLFFNETETRKQIEKAAKEIKPVVAVLKKDQIIAREGDPVSPEVLAKIKIMNKHSAKLHINFIIGIIFFQLLIYLIIALYLKDYFARTINDVKIPILTFFVVTGFFLYAFFAYRQNSELNSVYIFALALPIPFIIITLSLLCNIYIAFLAGIYAVTFVNVISNGDNASTVIASVSLLISIFASKNIEKRTDFLNVGIGIAVVNSILSAAIGFIDDYSYQRILSNVKVSFISGLANTIAVMGLFPIFEHFFGATTRFRLLELMDLNSSIFKKMLIKAPGTYNHSIMVANLSEAAAKEINADHYLAKVGAFYHDIGKINDSAIYIENKKEGEKIEKEPLEYCRLIISHVEKGIRLAKELKLPDEVIDFIREHHGQSTMTFFYHQALEKASGESNSFVNQSDFQYPGPKPRTRETALVMLADAIEAASRSVMEPSYTKLETLVKKIIHNKLNEGELENCDLTLKDINKIQKAFIRILAGIFHTRIEYPDKEDIRKLEKQVNKSNE
ncbi:MAG: HDIG domain-containing protein [Spirochaetes bacterium]|nr:HDIG domain-containing protein [Spirochaetota bacterium]